MWIDVTTFEKIEVKKYLYHKAHCILLFIGEKIID